MGLLGSLHCVGICGPLIIAIPNPINKFSFITSQLIYHSGKSFTYVLLGAITATFASSLRLAGLQQWISIISGVLLLMLSLHLIIPSYFRINFLKNSSFIIDLKNKMTIYLKKTGMLNRFVLGALNGMLPCGLVYIALASANLHHTFTESISYMALFGLGTFPALFLVSLTKHLNLFKTLTYVYKYYPYAIVFMALILIVRGMNLGIPYISPEINIEENTLNCCHR
jgi:hypothetical protein